jgi:hypothetical protein
MFRKYLEAETTTASARSESRKDEGVRASGTHLTRRIGSKRHDARFALCGRSGGGISRQETDRGHLGALLLIPPCANIAILVDARTVTRRDEFTVRTALGASRGRIVMQLFVEVLVLAAGAGIAGLLLARELSGRLTGIVMPAMGPANLPYCMDFEPSDSR